MANKPFQSQLDEAERVWEETFGENHLTGFRTDLEEMWVETAKHKSFEENPSQLSREVNRSLQRPKQALRTIEDLLSKGQIVDGLTGGALAYLLYQLMTIVGLSSAPAAIPSIIVFAFFTSMNHGILYTKAFINLLCYNDASSREEKSRLLFKRAWNRKILVSTTSVIGILFAAFARAAWPKGYQKGLNIIERWLQQKLN